MTYTIRTIVQPDLAAAIELVRDSLAEFGLQFGIGSPTDEEMYGLPASYIERGGTFLVAVDAAGAVIGTAGVFPVEPGIYELRKMYLRKAVRGSGVGARLFDACRAFCRDRGARQIVLDTLDGMSSAIAFYERRGFVRDDAQIRGARCTRGYRLDLQ